MSKKVLITLVIILFFFYGFAQKVEIKSNEDYNIVNQTIKRYFKFRKISDSIFFSNISEFLKDSLQAKTIRRHKRRRKKLDTLYIKYIADKVIHKQFLEKDAHWKRNRYNKKNLPILNNIFSEKEVKHYNKQLEDNIYLWDDSKINFKDRVFVNHELELTRDEIKKLPEEKKALELKKIYDLDDKLNLYTFSKPIYSLNNKYAIIAYENGGTRILNIFERLDNQWKFKFSINNNMIISRVR